MKTWISYGYITYEWKISILEFSKNLTRNRRGGGGVGWGLVNTGIVKLMNIVWKRSIYEYIPIKIILLHKYLGTVCIYCSVTNYTYYLDLYSFRSLHSTVSLLKLTVGQHCSNCDYKWNACYTHASIHTKMS